MLFLIDVLFILYISHKIISQFHFHRQYEEILALWLMSGSIVYVTGYLFSLLDLLSYRWGWIVFHLLLSLACYFRLRGVNPFFPLIHFQAIFQNLPGYGKILMASCGVGAAGIFILNFFSPFPLGMDSITYHLPRVSYYIQQNSFDIYPASHVSQVYYPMGMEIFIIWIAIFTKSLIPYYLFQWLSVFAIMITLYALSRSLSLSPFQARIVPFVWLSTPIVFFHAAIVKNDLILISYLAPALLFLFNAEGRKIYYIFSSLALALAIGVKNISLFYAFSFMIAALFYLIKVRVSLHNFLYFLLSFILYSVLLSCYSYLNNFFGMGHLVPAYSGTSMFDIASVPVNLLRLSAELTDSVNLPSKILYVFFGIDIGDLRQLFYNLFRDLLGIDMYTSKGFWVGYSAKMYKLNNWYFQFTLGHCLLIAYSLLLALLKHRNVKVLCLILFSLVSMITLAGFILWHPWDNLRFYFPAITLLYPLAGFAFQSDRTSRVLYSLLCITVIIGLMSILYYFSPIYQHIASKQNERMIAYEWFGLSESEIQTYETIQSIPPHHSIGIEAVSLEFEQFAIGFQFERRVVPLPRIVNLEQIQELMSSKNLDAVICRKVKLEPDSTLSVKEIDRSLIVIEKSADVSHQ